MWQPASAAAISMSWCWSIHRGQIAAMSSFSFANMSR
jgi:hypothetical protein